MLRFDYIDVGKAEIDKATGWIKDKPILSRTGVFKYARADGSIRREYRPPEEVFHPNHLASLRGVPVTLDHPGIVHADNAEDVIGASLSIGEQDKENSGNLRGEVVIHKPKKLGGRRQLSLCYTLRLDESPGISPEGERYDAVQRDLIVNHIAVLAVGRAGNATLRMDGEDSVIVNEENPIMPTEIVNGSTTVQVRLDGGLSYAASPEVALALDNARRALEASTAAVKALETEREGLRARADAADAEVNTVRADGEAKLAKAASDAATAARARVALESVATSHGVEFKQDGDDNALKIAVIKKLEPSVNMDGKEGAYVDVFFDRAIESAKSRSDSGAAQRQTVLPTMAKPTKTDAPYRSAKDLRVKMISSLRG